MLYIITVFACTGLTIWQVYTTPLSDFIPKQPSIDNSTFANVDELFTYHFHLDVDVDFETKTVGGSVIHDLYVVSPTDKVVLDIWDMDISSIEYMSAGAAQASRDGV